MNSPATSISLGPQLLDVGQELRRDLGDGDVVDVDVLLANQVEQQIERPVVHLAHDHRKWRLLGVLAARFERRGNFFGGGWLSRRNCVSRRSRSWRLRRTALSAHRSVRVAWFSSGWSGSFVNAVSTSGLWRARPRSLHYAPRTVVSAICIASRTSTIVCSARTAAFREPSSRISIACPSVMPDRRA